MPLTTAPPPALLGPDGPRTGLWVGSLTAQMLRPVPGRGRIRRWSYAAAATPDGSVAIGAAVVHLGLAGTAFVWLQRRDAAGTVTLGTWERRLSGRRLSLTDPDEPARAQARDGLVRISASGGLQVALDDLDGAPLHVDLVARPGTPVVCATPTPKGGWNTTEKLAGHAVTGSITTGDDQRAFEGFGWRDWTAGRQDRHTTWRWAAAAGTSRDGRTVGLNASTGMNASGPGEDVAWIDGRPVPLDVTRLSPLGDAEGPWRIEGPGWGLDFTPTGVRAARENLVLVRSSYVQPIGTFRGTLPGPEGDLVEVDGLPGVTEDHEAHW